VITACFLSFRILIVCSSSPAQVEMFAASNEPMYVNIGCNLPSAPKVQVGNGTAPTYSSAPVSQNAPPGYLTSSIWKPDAKVHDLPSSSFWCNKGSFFNPNAQGSMGSALEEIGQCDTGFATGAFMSASKVPIKQLSSMSTMYFSEGSTAFISETLSESSETVSACGSSPGLGPQSDPMLALDALTLGPPPGLEPPFSPASNLGTRRPSAKLTSKFEVEFESAAEMNPGAEITTLMICDIPCRRNIEQLIATIDAAGFAKTYDFVYMPGRKGRRQAQGGNVGYAFVNFKKSEWAMAFMEGFQNIQFPDSASTKLGYAKPARDQGFAANYVIHGRKSAVGSLLTFCDDSQYMQ